MSSAEHEWEHPELKRFIKTHPEGDSLFRQGEPGDTFFLVLRGIVRLTAERDGQELMVRLAEAGEVLGEKCLIDEKPFKRFFGAVAQTEVLAAELRAADMKGIESAAPALATDIFRKISQVSIDRLYRADHLIKILRSSDNIERLIYLIAHFAYFQGHTRPTGTEVILPMETIRYYIAMSPFEIEECLAELHRRKIFVSEGNNCYVLMDQKALLKGIAAIKDSIPMLKAI